MTILREIVTKSEWIIAVLALYVVAWTRFNSPPTNRSGTTFALFFFGVIFYYALIVALWVLVMIGLVQGSIGFDWIGKALTKVNPEAQIQLAQYAPIVAALIIVVASQFRRVLQIDSAARMFCVKFAAIPREADQLAIELAQGADFRPTERLRSQVTENHFREYRSAGAELQQGWHASRSLHKGRRILQPICWAQEQRYGT